MALYFIVCTPISYFVGRERIFDDVTANTSNEYVTIKVDRHVVLVYADQCVIAWGTSIIVVMVCVYFLKHITDNPPRSPRQPAAAVLAT
eukprot:COSAG01_NODE_3198_length_6430_cov_10.203759_3_plen_89_part_00